MLANYTSIVLLGYSTLQCFVTAASRSTFQIFLEATASSCLAFEFACTDDTLKTSLVPAWTRLPLVSDVSSACQLCVQIQTLDSSMQLLPERSEMHSCLRLWRNTVQLVRSGSSSSSRISCWWQLTDIRHATDTCSRHLCCRCRRGMAESTTAMTLRSIRNTTHDGPGTGCCLPTRGSRHDNASETRPTTQRWRSPARSSSVTPVDSQARSCSASPSPSSYLNKDKVHATFVLNHRHFCCFIKLHITSM